MLSIHPRSASRRSAFTLIEMLVVIAIIAILTTLIVAGVMAVMKKGPQVQTRNDLLQMNTALQNFYAKYKFYPPSQLKLHSNYAQYKPVFPPAASANAAALDAQSIAAISRMFPQLTSTTWVNIKWDGAVLPAAGLTLEGDQCLVFFLCGIPNGNNSAPLGFSTNPTNPAAAGGTRISFLTVDAARIYLFRANDKFPSYVDPWSSSPTTWQPYVYFSGNNIKNGYDTKNYTTGAAPVNTLFGVSPYIQTAATATAPTVYWNPDTFQLISAGLDTKWGTGGLCPPTSAHGKDDMANFTDLLLGNL